MTRVAEPSCPAVQAVESHPASGTAPGRDTSSFIVPQPDRHSSVVRRSAGVRVSAEKLLGLYRASSATPHDGVPPCRHVVGLDDGAGDASSNCPQPMRSPQQLSRKTVRRSGDAEPVLVPWWCSGSGCTCTWPRCRSSARPSASFSHMPYSSSRSCSLRSARACAMRIDARNRRNADGREPAHLRRGGAPQIKPRSSSACCSRF